MLRTHGEASLPWGETEPRIPSDQRSVALSHLQTYTRSGNMELVHCQANRSNYRVV